MLPKEPSLSVCMIVRDEENMLPRCLRSVQDLADELIVVDTGSKDNTISIAKDFGAKIYHFKWRDDFAAARNESLRHATGDWILQIDADEELLSGSIPNLKDRVLESRVLCYVIRCDNGPRCAGRRFHWSGRLFRNHPWVQFSLPYHESIQQSVDKLISKEPRWQIQHEPNIIIRHYGYEHSESHRKYERGIRIMKSYLKENPNDAYILNRLGNACGGLGRYDEAETYLDKALEINPDCSETNYSLGLTLEKQGKPEAAIKCYKKVIAADPGFAEAYENLGAIYVQKGMLDDAISVLKRALGINSDLVLGHSLLGEAYYMKGMFDEAIAQYERVLRIDANNANVHFNLGRAYGIKGMINESITEYKRVVAINPDLAEAHHDLALTYYLVKEYDLAMQHCDKAIELGFKVHPEFLKELKAKKEERHRGFRAEMRRHPMRREIRAFLEKRGVTMDESSGLLYIVSMMASFLIYRSIKEHTQLPVIRPDEEKADGSRMERLGRTLAHECRQLHIEFQEVIDELVFPMAGNKALVDSILQNIYGMLDSLIPSDSFREGSEKQIENPEFWGDSLTQYADRKEDYFEAVKELFAHVLAIARPSVNTDLEKTNHEKELEEIRKKYGIDPDDFLKLRRRATEFFRIAFATYLGIVFQPLREEVDEKIYGPTSDS